MISVKPMKSCIWWVPTYKRRRSTVPFGLAKSGDSSLHPPARPSPKLRTSHIPQNWHLQESKAERKEYYPLFIDKGRPRKHSDWMNITWSQQFSLEACLAPYLLIYPRKKEGCIYIHKHYINKKKIRIGLLLDQGGKITLYHSASVFPAVLLTADKTIQKVGIWPAVLFCSISQSPSMFCTIFCEKDRAHSLQVWTTGGKKRRLKDLLGLAIYKI